jgi:hypothetical protein
MNDKIWKIIIPLTIAIISVFVGSYGWKLCEENHWVVPGTVIGKSETAVSHSHSRSISSNWWMAVKPDNSEYKTYDVCVDFATFASYDIGDHVSFEVMSKAVKPNGHDDFVGITLVILSIVFGIISTIALAINVITNEP